jgi:hypothetical protein
MNQDDQPEGRVVMNRQDVAEQEGADVTVIGIYETVEMPSKVPSSPSNPRPKDYARIILADGGVVYLEPYNTPAARRPEGERRQFDLKRVRVAGRIHRSMPARGESLISPCLSEIVEIVEDEGPQRPRES